MSTKLVFLKLGGSLITVKDQPHTIRPEVLERLAQEIAEAIAQDKDLHLLLGHGSGSFGHVAASQYDTRQGVKSAEDWKGFVEVWSQAAELDHLVIAALEAAELPAIVFPPSAMITAHNRKIGTWNLTPIYTALENGLLPVVYGDVVFDEVLGGTILSTEDLFTYLAPILKPTCLLFAGHEMGVWAKYPGPSNLLHEVTPKSFPHIVAGLKGSSATDVTGGMLGKVRQVISLVNDFPWLEAGIFTGEVPGHVLRSLLGEKLGTQIHAA